MNRKPGGSKRLLARRQIVASSSEAPVQFKFREAWPGLPVQGQQFSSAKKASTAGLSRDWGCIQLKGGGSYATQEGGAYIKIRKWR